MPIWNNTIAGASNPTGYGYAINPGITIKPIDIRPFLDDNGSSRSSSAGRSKKTTDETEPKKMRTGVRNQYQNNSASIESAISSLVSNQEEVMYNAVKAGKPQNEIAALESAFTKQLSQLQQMSMRNELVAQNEELQYDANRKAYADLQTKDLLNEYAVGPESTELSNETDMFYGRPFNLVRDGNTMKIETYQDVLNSDDINSGITTDMSPTKAFIPGAMNNSETVQKNIYNFLKDAGNYEYMQNVKSPDMYNAMLQNGAKTVTGNAAQIISITNNIWEKMSPEDRKYIMNRTLKNGIVRKVDGKEKFIPGNVVLNDIDINQKKYTELRQKYEDALAKNDNSLAEQYFNESEKYRVSGEKLSKEIMGFAKANAINIATGKAIGLKSMSLTTDEGVFGSNGELNDDEATELMQVYSKGISLPQRLYFEYGDKETGTNEAFMRDLTDNKGSDMHRSFNLTPEAKNIISNKGFGVERADLLEKENIPLSKMGAFFIMNGIYSHKNALGDYETLEGVTIKSIGDSGSFMPKFYNPVEGQTYSDEIQRNGKGVVIGQPYVDIVMTTENSDVQLPMLAADGKTVITKSIKEIYALPEGTTNYRVAKDSNGKYVFHVYQEAPNPYYGSTKVTSVGNMAAWSEAQDAEQGRYADAKSDQYFNQLLWDKLMKDESGNYKQGSFAYGKAYTGTPEEIFTTINNDAFTYYPNNEDYDKRKKYMYQILDNLVDNSIDKNAGLKIKQDVITFMQDRGNNIRQKVLKRN